MTGSDAKMNTKWPTDHPLHSSIQSHGKSSQLARIKPQDQIRFGIQKELTRSIPRLNASAGKNARYARSASITRWPLKAVNPQALEPGSGVVTHPRSEPRCRAAVPNATSRYLCMSPNSTPASVGVGDSSTSGARWKATHAIQAYDHASTPLITVSWPRSVARTRLEPATSNASLRNAK
jgi:hypothetical protein